MAPGDFTDPGSQSTTLLVLTCDGDGGWCVSGHTELGPNYLHENDESLFKNKNKCYECESNRSVRLYWTPPGQPEMPVDARCLTDMAPPHLPFMDQSNTGGRRMTAYAWERCANDCLDRCSLSFHLNTLHQP